MSKELSASHQVGGVARTRKLSAKQQSVSGTKAAKSRWTQERARKPASPSVSPHSESLIDPVAWIEEYLINPDSGVPFELYPAQQVFLREAFALDPTLTLRYSEVIFAAPKKSGKTAMAAIACCYVIFALGGMNAEGYVASNSREQASDRVFSDITRILKASPKLRDAVGLYTGRIECFSTGAFIKTLTTEAASAAGPRPTIVIFDELWGFTNQAAQRLWDELVPTPTVPISLRLTVTYAGFVGESKLLEDLYRQVFSQDGTLQEGVERVDTDLYRLGRMLMYWTHEPRAPWQTPAWLEDMRRAYASRPSQFERIIRNRWISSESTFVQGDLYDRCVDTKLTRRRSSPRLHVCAAVDASVRKDSTAIVTVALDAKEFSQTKSWLADVRTSKHYSPNPLVDMVAALPWKEDIDDAPKPVTLEDLRVRLIDHHIIIPAQGQVDFLQIEQYVLGLSRRFTLDAVLYDPYQMVALAQGLMRRGIPMVELSQTPAHVMGFSSLLLDLISQSRLRLYPASDLRAQVLNAVAKESARSYHIVKRTGSAKIDAAVALAMACYGCAMHFNIEPEQAQAPATDIFAV